MDVVSSSSGYVEPTGGSLDKQDSVLATTGNENLASLMPSASKYYHIDDVTKVTSASTIYSSYEDPVTESSQFPMQHATHTQHLPGNLSPITTTAPLLLTSGVFEGQSISIQIVEQSDLPSRTNVTQSSSFSVTVNSPPSISTGQNVLDTSAVSVSKAITRSTLVSPSSDIDSLVTDSGLVTDQWDGMPVSNQVTDVPEASIEATVPLVDFQTSRTGDVPVVSSQMYSASSRALYSTHVPTETTFSSPFHVQNSISLKTTEAASVPPPAPSGKPMVPAANEDSTILGGGLSDYIVYIGAPLCGLGIIILLILCIVCIRRRKLKHKGSPAKNHVPDLWVNNSGSDIPLTARSVPEQNGGEAVLTEDIGELSTHLPLKQGDRVTVHRKEAAGWWQGTAGGQTGWFPSNYVQAAPLDHVKTENEVDTHDDSHVSSFMLKRPETPNQRQSFITESPNHRISNIDTANHSTCNNQRQSAEEPKPRKSVTPTEEEIQAEPIYCKIQPKEKRKSESDRSSSTTPTKCEYSVIQDLDTEYTALYPFLARVEGELSISKGDIILCKESSDRNGWMRGINESTQQEGWVPASYVQKIEKEEAVPLDLDPSSYKQLEVNTDMDNRQDLVGIMHRAVHTFCAEKAGDLEFQIGDLITVFQVLENGWWLGCKNKTVGWFPGSFVEMIDQPSSSPSPSSVSSVQSHSDSPVPSEQLSEDTLCHLHAEESPRPSAQSTPKTPTKSKLKPVRKAPLPPNAQDHHAVENQEADKENKPGLNMENKSELIKGNKPVSNKESKVESKLPMPAGSRLPKYARPKVPPPLPPTKTETMEHESPLYESIKDKPESRDIVNGHPSKPQTHIGVSAGTVQQDVNKHEHSNEPQSAKKDKIKPPVPKRFIKPKFVTVPKTEVQLPDKDSLTKGLVSGEIMKLRSPPPPKPGPPKLGPIRAKLSEPKPLEDQIPNDVDDTYFHVTPRKFDAIIRQESSEHEADSDPPYRSLSSFGITSFGGPRASKPFSTVEEKHGLKQNTNQTVASSSAKMIVPDAHGNRKSDDANTVDENINENVANAVETKQVNVDNESKLKSGIPVQPKMKASRLPPPKPVASKVSEVVDGSDKKLETDAHVTDISVASPSKIPTGVKPLSASKILNTQEVSEQSSNDTNVFQYPDTEVRKSEEIDTYLKHGYDHNINDKDKSFETDDLRPRTDSIGKPPVAPKPKSSMSKLVKPKTHVRKDALEDKTVDRSPAENDKSFDIPPDSHSPVLATENVTKQKLSESESESESKSEKISKIPLGSAVTQQPSKQRERKSNIPSPNVRTKSIDRDDKVPDKKLENEADSPVSPNINLRQKPESPRSGRKLNPKQMGSVDKPSLRNRSNSPSGRSGIPTIRNRSNSPAPKSSGIPLARTNSPALKTTPSSKPSGIMPPKKILNGVDNHDIDPSVPDSADINVGYKSEEDELERDTASPKTDRPSKPARVQKQKSQDGKPPKQGRSLLPVVHKTMETAAGSQNEVSTTSAGTKPKRGIPVAKPSRLPGLKTGSPDDHSEPLKKTLHLAVRGYTAQIEGELSFSEGTFVKELSDCDRPGWCVGMLADGTTGLYPADHFKPSPVSAQSEA